MKEFVEEFGKDNFMIIFWVVVVIVVALIIIILIEKLQNKRKLKKEINKEIDALNKLKNENNNIKSENTYFEEESLDDYVSNEEDNEEEIVYVKNEPTIEEAKEKLEEVTKKLVTEDSDLIEHTHFETEQEEKSIISYQELLNASYDIDEKNDKLLEDEGEAAITLEELYQKHVDDQDKIEEEALEGKVSNPEFVYEEEKKFKNSEVISPVFGFYSGKVKQVMDEEEFLETLDSEDKPKDIETEIEKTEEFLSELKRLKNKLD